ncbi:hypothetical protein [Caballeronia terrestris]|uniref:hypothetical protein n=1 Tax=Caballeronia terrestris TaxID=1226301 RepID=UPI000ACE8442|nr:hypothetical protein [Caballeronia terrestris]
MFDLAEKECKTRAGVACVILCAAAIEALVGDIALCLIARKDVADSDRERSQQARSSFEQKQAIFTTSAISPLDAIEESSVIAFRNVTQNKSSGLDPYFVDK